MGDAEDTEDAEGEILRGLTETVIGAAMEVHSVLGPGFVESFYEQALCVELAQRAIAFSRQAGFPVFYKGMVLGEARADLVVDGRLLVELKATAGYAPIHLAQVLSYLKASGLTLGLLIHFNVPSLRFGIRRVVRTPAPGPSETSVSSASSSPPFQLPHGPGLVEGDGPEGPSG